MEIITLSVEDLLSGDFDQVRDISPYAHWTEQDVLNHMSRLELLSLIVTSSYYQKKAGPVNIAGMSRSQLLSFYLRCREYATKSIIDALYPVDKLTTEPIQHLYCGTEKFYILSRVRTKYEQPTIEETAKVRPYLSFTLASHLNLSHYPGKIWYGYSSGITPEMIGLILSHDADTRSWARNRRELGLEREELLDAEDLVKKSTKCSTYSQISVESNTKINGVKIPIKADCILCVDDIDDGSGYASEDEKLPIIILHSTKRTIHQVYDYCKVL